MRVDDGLPADQDLDPFVLVLPAAASRWLSSDSAATLASLDLGESLRLEVVDDVEQGQRPPLLFEASVASPSSAQLLEGVDDVVRV